MYAHRLFAAAGVLTLLTLTSPVPGAAQHIDGWGVVGGLNRTTLAGGFPDLIKDHGGIINPRYGVTVGAWASRDLDATTRLRGEATISQRGYRVPNENGVKRRELDLTYLDLAALMRREIPVGGASGWVGGGPIVSMKLSEAGIVGDSPSGDFDDVDGLDLGIALEAGISRDKLDVGLRYAFGLANVSKSTDPDEGAKNRGLGLVFAYRLGR